ncbi:hypothetical protein J8273_8389 [Carpediemonas membranifera]|uniref:TRAPPC10/Trs130 N-terminal domain-containing protein n=1 Tax=Carpediemonas membranifera TaxID=201153 RepID=A0A8J6ARP4_9EUKA|nr:hypothetical protein J8273_8389 [Carpediemonas membranifera]|eukprot:KAG9389715.1 hypothetical protein J8273_8389 [Carpediemonas membranifera]
MDYQTIVAYEDPSNIWGSLWSALSEYIPLSSLQNVTWTNACTNAEDTIERLPITFKHLPEVTVAPHSSDGSILSLEAPVFDVYLAVVSASSDYVSSIRPPVRHWLSMISSRATSSLLVFVPVDHAGILTSDQLGRNHRKVWDKMKQDFATSRGHPSLLKIHTGGGRDSPLHQLVQHIKSGVVRELERRMMMYHSEARRVEALRGNRTAFNLAQFVSIKESIVQINVAIQRPTEAIRIYDELDALCTNRALPIGEIDAIASLRRCPDLPVSTHGLSHNILRAKGLTETSVRFYFVDQQRQILEHCGDYQGAVKKLMDFTASMGESIEAHAFPPHFPLIWRFCMHYSIAVYAQSLVGKTKAKGAHDLVILTANLFIFARNLLDQLYRLSQAEDLSTPTLAADIVRTPADPTTVAQQWQGVQTARSGADMGAPPTPPTPITGSHTRKDSGIDASSLGTAQTIPPVLRRGLTTESGYRDLYLKFTDMAILHYTMGGRHRTVSRLHGDAAFVHFARDEYQDAEVLFKTFMRSFFDDGWHDIGNSVRGALAKCQKALGHHSEYIALCLEILASDPATRGQSHDVFESFGAKTDLDSESLISEIIQSSQQLMQPLLRQVSGPLIHLSATPLTKTVMTGQPATIKVKVNYLLDHPLPATAVSVVLVPVDPVEHTRIAGSPSLTFSRRGVELSNEVDSINVIGRRTSRTGVYFIQKVLVAINNLSLLFVSYKPKPAHFLRIEPSVPNVKLAMAADEALVANVVNYAAILVATDIDGIAGATLTITTDISAASQAPLYSHTDAIGDNVQELTAVPSANGLDVELVSIKSHVEVQVAFPIIGPAGRHAIDIHMAYIKDTGEQFDSHVRSNVILLDLDSLIDIEPTATRGPDGRVLAQVRITPIMALPLKLSARLDETSIIPAAEVTDELLSPGKVLSLPAWTSASGAVLDAKLHLAMTRSPTLLRMPVAPLETTVPLRIPLPGPVVLQATRAIAVDEAIADVPFSMTVHLSGSAPSPLTVETHWDTAEWIVAGLTRVLYDGPRDVTLRLTPRRPGVISLPIMRCQPSRGSLLMSGDASVAVKPTVTVF